jgi:beta-lactamase regulating signal transducer with metallopeptidase domain
MKATADIICLTLMHSLWQAAILAALVFLLLPFQDRIHPGFRKRLILICLITQLAISVFTALQVSPGLVLLKSKSLIQSIDGYPITEFLFLCYSAILTFKLLKLYRGMGKLPSLLYKTEKAPAEIRIFTAQKSAELSIKRKVSVLLSDLIRVPCTFGFWKPVILMPSVLLTRLSPEQIEMLILHELWHIRQNDYLINIFLRILEALYFFNPFISLLIARMKLERESDCDQQVMQHPYSEASYATALYGLAGFNPGMTLAAAFEKGELLKRIKRLPELKSSRHQANAWIIFPILLLLLSITSFLLPEEMTNKQNSIQEMATLSNFRLLQQESALLNKEITGNQIQITAHAPAQKKAISGKNKPIIKKPNRLLESEDVRKGNQEDLAEISDGTEEKLKSVARYASKANDMSTKTITLVEQSGNKTVTKYYRLFYKDNGWYYLHLWTLEERTVTSPDSAQ